MVPQSETYWTGIDRCGRRVVMHRVGIYKLYRGEWTRAFHEA